MAFQVQREDYLATPVAYNPMYQGPPVMEPTVSQAGLGSVAIYTKPREIPFSFSKLERINREKKK